MPTRRALVAGAGIAGLATAVRLRRSDWEVVLLEHASGCTDEELPCALQGAGRDAAARLGLLKALTARNRPRETAVSVLREAVGVVEVRRRVEVVGLVEDDCGVTVEFDEGDADWFDLVVVADSAVRRPSPVPLSEVDEHFSGRRAESWTCSERWASRQIVLVGDAAWCSDRHREHNASLDIAGAELLGDALDIVTDTAEALLWWEEQMSLVLGQVRRQGVVPEKAAL